MPDPKNNKKELPKKVDTTLADNMKMVLEKHKRQNNQAVQENSKILDNRFKKQNIPEKVEIPINMESALYKKMLTPASPFNKSRCWTGYEPVPGKKPYSKGSCRKK